MNPSQKDIEYVKAVLLNKRVRDAEDSAASAWLWAWEHRSRFDYNKSGLLTSWVIQIALNLAMTYRRSERWRKEREARYSYYMQTGCLLSREQARQERTWI